MEQGPRGTGPTRRRWTCEKDRARAEMEQEQSKRDCDRESKMETKGRDNDSTTACIFALETRTTLRSLPETFQTTTLPSSSRYLVPST